MDETVKEMNQQISEKIELQNTQMKVIIKETVNSTLIKFQKHIISSVEGMMTLQLEHINTSFTAKIQTVMQSSPMVQNNIPKLSMKTIKKISPLQQETEPTTKIINNITPTQNENTTIPPMKKVKST